MKCEDDENTCGNSYFVDNNFCVGENEITPGSIMFFEFPMQSFDLHKESAEYFYPQKGIKYFKAVDDNRYQTNWNDTYLTSKSFNQETVYDIEGDLNVGNNYEFDERISEEDVDASFEEDEFKGLSI